MDAHLFRRVCEQLSPLLRLSRIDAIAALAPHILQFKLYGATGKYTLIIHISRDKPCLMLVPQALSPQAFGQGTPSAPIMRLRKYAVKRRIVAVSYSWLTRCLYLHIGGETPCVLTIDSGHGVYIQPESSLSSKRAQSACPQLLGLDTIEIDTPEVPMPAIPMHEATENCQTSTEPIAGAISDAMGEAIVDHELSGQELSGQDEIAWPSPEEIYSLATNTAEANEVLWRRYPVLTPALRRSLVHLEPMEQQALLMDLQEGGGDVFGLYDAEGICAIHAWPVPEAVSKGRTQKSFEDVFELLGLYGKRIVLDVLAHDLHREERKQVHADTVRLQRLLEHLDRDFARLTAMQSQQEDALRLQTWLHSLPTKEKMSSLSLPPYDGIGSETSIALNPALTIRENMEAKFYTALRGKRGFAHVARRRQEVLQALEALERGQVTSISPAGVLKKAGKSGQLGKNMPKTTSKAGAKTKIFPKNIQVSTSKDGFTLWRGRDAKGNLAVLRHAAPHDVWVHVEDGPGAHVIIRRDHPQHTIPESTMHEAARLCASKSWCSGVEGTSEITVMTAFVRHVRPRRGAALGMVDIQSIENTIRLVI